MSDHSKIGWTEATWNPTLGCDKVSAGCTHCYAIQEAWKKQHHPNPKIAAAYAGLVEQRSDGSLNWTGKVACLPERLALPLRWQEPRRVFVNSLSDLFHEDVPDEFIDQVFATMAWTPHHTYQVLTKRPERMLRYVTSEPTGILERKDHVTDAVCGMCIQSGGKLCGTGGEDCELEGFDWPLPNVWLGVSVENQDAADNRVPLLLQTPAAVRFLSCEPLLGAVDLTRLHYRDVPTMIDCLSGEHGVTWPMRGRGPHIDWLIAGGESGPNARPMHPSWARSLQRQCQAAGVAYFLKQWGQWQPICSTDDEDPFDKMMSAGVWDRHLVALDQQGYIAQGENDPIRGNWCDYQPAPGSWWMAKVGKKAAGRLLDGQTWDEYPGTTARQLVLA